MAKSGWGHFSAKRILEAVLRLLPGEDFGLVFLELGVNGATLAQGRERFLEARLGGLRTRVCNEHNAQIKHVGWGGPMAGKEVDVGHAGRADPRVFTGGEGWDSGGGEGRYETVDALR